MKNIIGSFLGTLLAIVVVAAIVGVVVLVMADSEAEIEKDSWLVVELYGELPEYDPPSGVVGELTGDDVETLTRVLDNLDKARVDDRIEGVILKTSWSGGGGPASMQEIRDKVRQLRDADKKVYGWAESLSERQYYLLAACDEIVAPPAAYIRFIGFSSGMPHVKGALEKLGINPNVSKIKDYKSAAELVTRDEMSEPARENRRWLLEERWQMYTEALAADRGLDEARVVALMEHAVFSAEEARQAGLVDRVAYWSEFAEGLADDDDEPLRTVSSERYGKVERDELDLEGDKTIAVIHAQGTIAGRENGVNPLLGITMGHETISRELERARRDEDVAAIVLRIDSGGGDGLASDMMGDKVEVTARDKPVVVSMVDVAASGGYEMAYRASSIVADPMTVAGSIGSIAAKFNLAGLYDRLGISHSHVTRGPMALMDASDRDFSEQEWQRFTDNHWDHFNRWLADVAEHRGMSFEEAEKLAHGRVFSGRQSVANGLVDSLGGLDHAVEVAKELAGIPTDEQVSLAHFPEKKDLVESLLGGDDEVATAARWTVYRMMREDLAETWRMIEQQPELLDAAFAYE
jgi:protease-4